MNLNLPGIVNLIAGLILLLSLTFAKSIRKQRIASPLSLLLIALSLRCFFYGLELVSTGLGAIKTFHLLGFASMSFTGVFWVYLCSSVAGKEDKHWMRRHLWMLIIPLISIVLLATNSSHLQFYRRLDLVVTDGLSYLSYQRGDIWWLNLIYASVCWAWGLWILIRKVRQGSLRWSDLSSYMMAFSLIPLIVIILLALGWQAGGYYRPSPLALVLASMLLLVRYYKPRIISKGASQKGSFITLLPDPVFIIDPHKELVPLNPAAQKVLSKASSKLLSALESGEELRLEDDIYEARLLDNPGPVLAKNSAILYLRDISAPAKALELTQAQLQEASVTIGRQELLLREAEASERSQNQFLVAMDHEIRTPLNSLLGFTELLHSISEDPSLEEYVQGVQLSASRLMDQIDKLMIITGIETGKKDSHSAKVNLIKLLEDCVQRFSLSADEKALELILDIRPNVPLHIYLDPRILSQILSNLLSNAVKFCHSGEVILRVERKESTGSNAHLLFSVTDTGPGLDEEQKLDIHKALGHDKSSELYEGHSMGFLISGMLLGKMGSRLDFESQLGKGSSFFFGLQCPFEKQTDSPEPDILPHLKCLVIDDSSSHALYLNGLLERLGSSCSVFNHPLGALEYLSQNPLPDLIFVDYQMPDADGFSVISAIAKKLERPIVQLPIILMHPGLGQDEIRDECHNLGIKLHLPKPITFNALIRCLYQFTGHKEKPEALQPEVVAPLSTRSLKDKIVLVADDAALSVSMVRSMISSIMPEVTVIGAASGVEALQAARDYNLDLVLMDIQMPDMDGLEATAILRTYSKYDAKHLPIIALTADNSQALQDRYLASGLDDCLVKPVSMREIAAVLEQYLR